MNRKDCPNSTIETISHHRECLRYVLVAFSVCSSVQTVQAGSGPQQACSVKLWPTAVVTEDAIHLRDVVELRGFDAAGETALAETLLGEAPPPGGSRIVSLADVRTLLAASSMNMAAITVKGSAECIVRRPAAAKPPESVVAAPLAGAPAAKTRAEPAGPAAETLRDVITRWFDSELSAYGAKADLQFGRTSAQVLDLARPEYDFRIRRQPGPVLGLANVEASILRDGQELQRVAMVVSVAMMRDVVVARNPINKGATVEESDLAVVARRFTRPEETGLSDPGEAIGLRAKRFIAGGEMIQVRELERVPLVKRGQMVEVVSRIGGITVKTAAKAADDGGYGEAVTLHVPGRKGDHLVGRVSGPRRVEMDDGARLPADDSALAQGGGQ